jgi:hypothetical protein
VVKNPFKEEAKKTLMDEIIIEIIHRFDQDKFNYKKDHY